MIGLNWITKKSGWKTCLYILIVVLLLLGLVTGVYYYLFGGASLLGMERIFSLFEEEKKAKESLEMERNIKIIKEKQRYEEEKKEEKEKLQKENRERLEKMPHEKTAEEMQIEIEKLLDKGDNQ